MRASRLLPIFRCPVVFLPASLVIVIALCASPVAAGPIYVYKEPDGSTRFSSKPPPAGVQAKVFSASKANFSIYRSSIGSFSRRGRLFRNLYNEAIGKAASSYGICPYLIKAVIHVESAFNSRAVSPKGAQGLMQLMPATAQSLGVRNVYMPDENIDGGARHLARLIVKYNGDLKLALAAYNAGEQAVERYQGIPPYQETQQYVRRVLELRDRYRSSSYG